MHRSAMTTYDSDSYPIYSGPVVGKMFENVSPEIADDADVWTWIHHCDDSGNIYSLSFDGELWTGCCGDDEVGVYESWQEACEGLLEHDGSASGRPVLGHSSEGGSR